MEKRKIMEKIDRDNQRMLTITKKKEEMMNMKFQLLRELDAQRSAIMEDFERKKANNQLDIYAYAKEFNIDIQAIQGKRHTLEPTVTPHLDSLQRNSGGSQMMEGGEKATTKGDGGKTTPAPAKKAKAPTGGDAGRE